MSETKVYSTIGAVWTNDRMYIQRVASVRRSVSTTSACVILIRIVAIFNAIVVLDPSRTLYSMVYSGKCSAVK